jgi:dihydroorotase
LVSGVVLSVGLFHAQAAVGQTPATTPAAPYLESPTPYPNAAPSGCTGCPATPAEAHALVAQGQASGAATLGPPAAPVAARRVGPKPNQPNPLPYDLILKGGHVIDVKNNIDRVMDVALKDGKVAAAAEGLKPEDAAKTIDVHGLYVVPGLIDLHMHMYASTGEGGGSYAGDDSIWPDGFTLRNGVTTAVDAGSSGWRNFEDFKDHVIDRSITRVLAMLNIVGAGMRGALYEDNLADMNAEPTAWMAKRYPGVIVGIKSAHFTGPEWQPYIEAVKAGTLADIPVMIDYGANRIERPMYELMAKYLRPGDIYTHAYSGLRGEQNPHTLKPSAGLIEGRKRGIFFDAGTGGGSFQFRVAYPLIQDGFKPDSLSTDLHIGSMNSSTKDMMNVMSKFMAMGLTLHEVVADATWHPAQEIKQYQLGNLSVGAPGDVAVLSLEHGQFGYTDMDYVKMMSDSRLVCQLTLRDGRIVYDLNGISMDLWNGKQTSDPALAAHWTTFVPRPALPEQLTPTQK